MKACLADPGQYNHVEQRDGTQYKKTASWVLPKLNKAIEGLDGHGGGHEHACGCNVKKRDWDEFLGRIKEQL